MWERLQQDHNLVIGKETVRHVLRIVDPEGVEQRSRHRLRRRKKGAKKGREKQKIKWNCWMALTGLRTTWPYDVIYISNDTVSISRQLRG